MKLLRLLTTVVLIISVCLPKNQVFLPNKNGVYPADEKRIENCVNQFVLAMGRAEELLSADYLSDSVKEKSVIRLEAIGDMERRIGCVFDQVVIIPHIDSIKRIPNGNLIAKVYETTVLPYHYESIMNSADIAAFGAWHEMEFVENNGHLCISRDSFDESNVTGVSSGDQVINELIDPRLLVSQEEDTCCSDEHSQLRTPFSYSASQLNSLLSYAMQYCGIPESDRIFYEFSPLSGAQASQQTYNPLYVNHNPYGGDCCNYVSQCVYSGSMPTSSTWGYTITQDKGLRNGTYSWINTAGFKTYFEGQMYSVESVVHGNYSNVFPGNPVFWLKADGNAKNHNMICVGYNSGGLPILCAHNADLYRMPITNYLSNNTLKTLKIANSNNHTVHLLTYKYNDSKHYLVCGFCEALFGSEYHTPGVNGACSVCGAMCSKNNGVVE